MTRQIIWVAVLIGAIAAGGWLRARGISERALWYDEADTWNAAVFDVARETPITYDRFFRWTNHFETAPLSFLTVRVAVDALGADDEWIMRLPALVFGILCIPAAFMLGRAIRGPDLGAALSWLVALDPNAVDQSQQCRMYALYLMLTLLVLAVTIRVLRVKPHGPWPWVGLGLLMGLLLATLQFSLCVLVGVGAAVVVSIVGRARQAAQRHDALDAAKGFALSCLIALLTAHVGVYLILERVFFGGPGDAPDMSYAAIAREIIVAAKDLIGVGLPGLGFYLIAAMGLILLWKHHRIGFTVLALVAAANLLMLFPFRRMHHFLDPRYLTAMQPLLWVGLLMPLVYLKSKAIRIPMGIVLAVYLSLTGYQSYALETWHQQPDKYLIGTVIRDLDEYKTPDTALAYHPQVLQLLGRYYDHPEDDRLQDGLYEDTKLKAEARVPSDFDAPRTVLVIGMLNWDGRIERAKKVVETLAAHYDAPIDPSELNEHLQLQRVCIVTFSQGQAKWESLAMNSTPKGQ